MNGFLNVGDDQRRDEGGHADSKAAHLKVLSLRKGVDSHHGAKEHSRLQEGGPRPAK